MLWVRLRQEAHQPVLHAVGVLELVDQHVVEALGQLGAAGLSGIISRSAPISRPPKSVALAARSRSS